LGFSPIAESSTAQFLVLPLISWCGITFNGVEFHLNMGVGFLLGFFAKSENYFRMDDAASLTGK